jgi:6-pyruvoyltetrahydropterin/6-carboxytetrahydropterin synthase
MIVVTRYHDFSAGHCVTGHESHCHNLHGHNYRVTFTVHADVLDSVGRVLDFSIIKKLLCTYLEDTWDHRFLIWEDDPRATPLKAFDGVRLVPFNPTAENMADYLLRFVGPVKLQGTGCTLAAVRVEETRKCAAEAHLHHG